MEDSLVFRDELNNPFGAEDLEISLPAVHRHRLQKPRKSDNVVTWEVRDKGKRLFVQAEAGSDNGPLTSLAAIEEAETALVDYRNAGETSVFGRRCRRGPEELN